MFPIFSASTGAIALISISMERSIHGGVHCENCTAKACHMAKLKLWRFEWGQLGASGALLEKSQSFLVPGGATKPILFELIAKLTDAISCTQSKSLCVAMVMELVMVLYLGIDDCVVKKIHGIMVTARECSILGQEKVCGVLLNKSKFSLFRLSNNLCCHWCWSLCSRSYSKTRKATPSRSPA